MFLSNSQNLICTLPYGGTWYDGYNTELSRKEDATNSAERKMVSESLLETIKQMLLKESCE